jgi:hypothetical protein
MLAIAAIAQNAEHQLRRRRAGAAKVRCNLQVDQTFNVVRARSDIAATDGSGDRLRKAADPDHPGEAVEGSKSGRWIGFKFGEDVILHDDQIVCRRYDKQLMGGLKRQSRAGRIMQGGVGEIHPRTMSREHLGEYGRIGACGRKGNTDQFHSMDAQQSLEIEVAGIIDQNRVARLKHIAANKINRLRAGGREKDLIGTCLNSFIGKLTRKQSAQGEQAAWVAVFGQSRCIVSGKAADRAAHGNGRHPVSWKPTAARFQQVRAAIQRLARHP